MSFYKYGQGVITAMYIPIALKVSLCPFTVSAPSLYVPSISGTWKPLVVLPCLEFHVCRIIYVSGFCCCCCCWVISVVSDSVRPHRRQSTRLPRPWDSPGKNTGVGCHFLLQCMKVKSESEVAQLCLTLSGPMDCSLPGSSVHGIFQARILEWVAIAFSVSGFYHLA